MPRNRLIAITLLLVTGTILGCGKRPGPADTGSRERQPPPTSERTKNVAAKPPVSGPRFELLPAERTGVDFTGAIDAHHPLRYLYHAGFFCGGVAIGDVDGDERPDLYLVSGPGENRLYRQVDEFRFEDVTDAAGVDGGDAWGAGAAMFDVDDDGDLDIYVCNYDAPNLLFVNDGHGRFTERAEEYRLDVADACLQPAFCDYDRDGDLDLFLLTYRLYHPHGAPDETFVSQVNGHIEVVPKYQKYFGVIDVGDGRPRLRPIGRPDRLLRNDGGKFTDVSRAAGLSRAGFGNSATWWDYDEDGWPDLYVGNDLSDDDRLYHNNGDGTFSNVIAEVAPHSAWFAMGADAADLDGDGRLDFLIADMSATTHFMQKTTMGTMGAGQLEMERKRPHQYMHNALYLNTGAGRFLEAAYLAGLADSNWTWAVKAADFDNDGRCDVFFTNGMTRSFNDSDHKAPSGSLLKMTEWDAYAQAPERREQNLAFANGGDLRFADVSRAWGLDHTGISGPAAYGDLDGDGDLDLVVANADEPVSIYRNNSTQGNWLRVALRGAHSNHYGVGAVIKIETPSGVQVRQMMPMTGFLSCNEPTLHFGLGKEESIRRVELQWPSGLRQVLTDVGANQRLVLTEPNAPPPTLTKPADQERRSRAVMFARSGKLPEVIHRERPYDDFGRQPLLPWKHSQLGPGIAVGDVDGDGDDDVYAGGAAGQAGALLIQDGGFHAADGGPWDDDRECEDLGALFFDGDGDGDADLYVASGGVEAPRDYPIYHDRLYLNDGNGRFERAPQDALRQSGSVVAAADFDRDGDLDLFVGGRIIPGEYPLAAASALLENDGGRFRDATAEVAASLSASGLVTGAVWSDADGDGWIDLLVTHEWGPVKLYRNRQGKLVDHTREARLADRLGWFNGVTAGDVDNDGDVDYLVTNFGLNTKYHASDEHPALLYYGDFEGRGRMRLVEAEYEDKTLFPIRGKSCSSRAMPFLSDEFKTYREFAAASLPEIYTEPCLEKARRFAANDLTSGVLLNDGRGRFAYRPLPRLAQIAPAFGAQLFDVDADGNLDAVLAQNFFSPQWETGRMDGGLGLLLLGDGKGNFRPVSPRDSGIVVPGDAKALAVIDIDSDRAPDLLMSVNNDRLVALENQADAAPLSIRLRGAPGNPTAVGARVTLVYQDGARQASEVSAGSGYLSQSTTTMFPAIGPRQLRSIDVRWPNGKVSTVSAADVTAAAGRLTIDQPQ